MDAPHKKILAQRVHADRLRALYESTGTKGGLAMRLDIGTIGQLIANGLGVLVLWLGLRSQASQDKIYVRTMTELVAALRASNEDRKLADVSRQGASDSGYR